MKHFLDTDDDFLERFTDVTNRSKSQTLFLYGLVQRDFEKLVELEEKLKNNHLSYCPSNKEEVERVLQMSYRTYWFKIPFCEHIETGCIGIIKNHLNTHSPAQYGIYWVQHTYVRTMQNHYYWNDKTKIKVLNKK